MINRTLETPPSNMEDTPNNKITRCRSNITVKVRNA